MPNNENQNAPAAEEPQGESIAAAEIPPLLDAGGIVYLIEDGSLKPQKGILTAREGERLIVKMQMTDEVYAQSPQQNASFHAALTSDTCTYHFDTQFTSSAPLPDHIWYMTEPASMVRQQSRSFVRVPAQVPVRVRLKNALGGLKNPKETDLVDLSGDGLCFISEEEVLLDSEVAVELPDLPEFGDLRTTVIVRRCAEHTRPTGVIYHIGAQMTENLTKPERMKLERCLAQLQRDYLKRGLGVK